MNNEGKGKRCRSRSSSDEEDKEAKRAARKAEMQAIREQAKLARQAEN